jgi:hypothetical protein
MLLFASKGGRNVMTEPETKTNAWSEDMIFFFFLIMIIASYLSIGYEGTVIMLLWSISYHLREIGKEIKKRKKNDSPESS